MSCSADRRTARDKFLSKRLYIFRHRAIIRKPWGRGSGGRAMRSQRIGQGFESPRLHQNPKDTAKSVSFGFLCSRQGSGPRVLRTQSVMENICSNTAGGVMIDSRAGSAAAPSGTIGAQIYILRQTSALMAKLPSSCPGDTPQSRCPSDFYVAGRGANLRATLHLCVPLRSFFLHTSERFIRAL